MDKLENPYVGPIPFGPEHQDIFFGRDVEASELLSLVVANRIVLLYAKSGAGKTSLLRARLIPDLEKEQFEVLPVTRVKGQIPDSIQPNIIVNLYVFNLIQSLASEPLDPSKTAQLEIRDYLRSLKRIPDQFGDALPRVLIVDQFEELFTLYPDRWRDREVVFRQLSSALENDPHLRIILSMREDYIAHLDSYTKTLADGIRARFRLELLRERSAHAAITEPVKVRGRVFQSSAAQMLVEELRKERGETSTGKTEEVPGEFIEPVQLQIVCSRMWRHLPHRTRQITSIHVQKYGDVDEALEEFYSDCLHKASQMSRMNERRLGIWIEKSLITPAQTRGTVYGGHGLDDPSLRNALIALAELHLLRVEWRSGSPWYELAHDRFINPIKNVNNKSVDATRSGQKIRRRVSLFLSYSRADEGFAAQLKRSLAEDGFDVWWDRERMPSRSLSFVQEIRDAIDNADKLVLIVSPEAVHSDYVRDEWEYALSLCKPIIPILFSGDYSSLPKELEFIHAIDFRKKQHYDSKLREIISVAETAADAVGELYDVPALPPSYVLRDDDFAKLTKTLLSGATSPKTTSGNRVATLYTLQGMGGVGKSVLAAAVARDCNIRRAFPDGIIWLEIGKSPNLLTQMADIGEIFGDDRREYEQLESARKRLRSILANKAVLIVLDDTWEADHVKNLQVAGPRCSILITTRDKRLAAGIEASSLVLDVLSETEGLTLLSERSGVPIDDNNKETFCNIVEVLAGHPLAISLAAAQIAERGEEFAPRLLERLSRQGRRGDPFQDLALDETSANSNLALSLSLSYHELTLDHQRRFRLLGIFASGGSFDIPAVTAVWDDSDREETEDVLNELIRFGLAERRESRYGQHPLLRAYSRALLLQQEELDRAFIRWADYYIELAASFRTLPPEQWNSLEVDLAQIIALGDELAEKADFSTLEEPMLLRCGQFAWNIIPLLDYRREILFVSEGSTRRPMRVRWLEMGLVTWRNLGDKQREAVTLNNIGRLWSDLSEPRRSLEFYEQALVLFREAGDRFGETNVLNNIGVTWDALGEKRRALEFYEQALPLRRAVGDRSGEATTLNNIGVTWDVLGEKRRALEFYEQALPLRRAVGDRSGEATTLNNIGGAWDTLGEKRIALEYYEQALPLFSAVGDRSGEAATLNNIGSVWTALGEKRKALEYYEQALPLRRAVGDRSGEATTLNNIGGAWDALGEKRKALEYYEQALPLFSAVGDRSGEAATLNNIGSVWTALDEKRRALEYYEQALPLRRAVGDRRGEAVTCFNIGMIYHSLGELDRAIEYMARCVELDEQIEHPDLENDRRVLEQLKRERDGDSSSQKEQVAQAMRKLAYFYAQGGADAVREALRGQAPDEVIETIIVQLAQSATSEAAPAASSTLPEETVQMLAGNTVAVKTSVPDKLDEWRERLQGIRADFASRGDDWAIEVAFADALLAVLDERPTSLPQDHPYSDVIRQVVVLIENKPSDTLGPKIDNIVEQLRSTSGENDQTASLPNVDAIKQVVVLKESKPSDTPEPKIDNIVEQLSSTPGENDQPI